MADDPITLYAAKAPNGLAAVCELLQSQIKRALPKGPARIWYAMPVWFVGENAVVGYKLTAKHVNLLFWNGQSFGETALKPAGKFKAAQIQYTDTAQVDLKALRRWLKLAGTQIWDYKAMRAASKAMKQKTSRKKAGVDHATVRELALGLPDVVDSSKLRGIAFKARGKLLACKAIHRSAEPETLVVRVGAADRDRLIDAEPDRYYLTAHYTAHESVLVRLPSVDRKGLEALLQLAWQFVTAASKSASRPTKRKKAASVFRYL